MSAKLKGMFMAWIQLHEKNACTIVLIHTLFYICLIYSYDINMWQLRKDSNVHLGLMM